MTDVVAAARELVAAMQEQGWDKQWSLPAEYDDLVDAIEDLPPIDAVMTNNTIRCVRCNQILPLPLPIPISALAPFVLYFSEVHRHCQAST